MPARETSQRWRCTLFRRLRFLWPDSGLEFVRLVIFTAIEMKIAIGSDHAGFRYKERIKQFLSELGHEVTDFGTHSEDPVDYPLFIRPVAEAVARREHERGVVLGGSGNGEAM